MRYVIGVDVGGTFTDLVCLDEKGRIHVTKTPSTPRDPSIAIMEGLSKVASMLDKDVKTLFRETTHITHGTTVSTNTVLTWSGAKVGLLCTLGFRDTLGIRFGIRENPYNFTIPQPDSLCPRYLRMPVQERINFAGDEVTPLSEKDVYQACDFFKKEQVEAVAICFLWSFKNPAHERRALDICRAEMPDCYVCASFEIQPEIREYWRMSTSVINAYVGPKLSAYLTNLMRSLKEGGFDGQLLITQSNAGVIFPEVAIEQAVRTVLSGPACAPAAAAYVGQALDLKNVITVDMGGTSFDVCLIKEGKPMTTLESAVGGIYHMKLPLVDVHTIGTGGGSIAWLDKMGVLHMGPQSAGSDPGPACYGKGGQKPTSTDADLVLGYLDPKYYLGGEMALYPELAHKVIEEEIARPLGLDVVDAAWAMRRIIDHQMVDGISIVSVQRGEDPRRYTLVVAGGAGALHAASLARVLGIRRLLVPKTSSVFCALGGVIADVRHDFVRSITCRMGSVDLGQLNYGFEEMRSTGDEYLEREGISIPDRYYIKSLDMRYKGQYHELEVPIRNKNVGVIDGDLDASALKQLVDEFHELHENLYSYRDTTETEILNLRLAACGTVHTPPLEESAFVSRDASAFIKGQRQAYFEDSGGFSSTVVYDGESMEVGNVIKGPAIVEMITTTILVPPDAFLEVTPYSSFLIELTK
ncbi:N-methylhydantoinase A/acetone carboxylase, beta subunit [uncultured Desulfatiglans sp.]|uniref:N-methylhydantoinase A/acetone carboxylase, beta subunit n=1 Tax=Uncultured Desulfatiglans sp. TaxID=1748965 RepID=A0A653AAY9_UNCDX|nr:N-methylhydantoinase A/acetone carboxylase, beta subunit [uncultured Desulfatiglans sp.]